MLTRENIEVVLERIRPFMRADGGDIELIDVGEHSAGVRLTGMCAGCPSAHMTLYVGVETAIREALPEFETLRASRAAKLLQIKRSTLQGRMKRYQLDPGSPLRALPSDRAASA